MTAFGGVVSQVQNRQFSIYVAGLLAVRIDLVLINDTGTVVTECHQVILDMRRCVRLRIAEDRIDGKPRQVCTVLVVRRTVDVLRLVKDGRGGRQEPVTRIMDVDIRGCRFEIIDIRRSYGTYISRVTRDQVRKLGINLEGRRRRRRDPWDLIDRVG